MTNYKGIQFPQISEILMQAAVGVSAVCGFKYTISDMVYSLSELSKKGSNGLVDPFYIAIREQGTESGYKFYCIERCKGLGYPIIIAKIEKNKRCGYDMKIGFTHGWMDGDNNNMEQEFNSL